VIEGSNFEGNCTRESKIKENVIEKAKI